MAKTAKSAADKAATKKEAEKQAAMRAKKIEAMTDTQKKAFIAGEKQEKFTRIALQRMPKVLKGIELLGNLAGSGYVSTDAQKVKIVEALRDSVNDVAAKFAGKADSAKSFNF